MARLGNKPLPIPEKVKAEFKSGVLELNGPAGKLIQKIHNEFSVKIDSGKLVISAAHDTRENSMIHGLLRGKIKNDLEGVAKGFKKDLEIQGLGYKASVDGKNLLMNIGFSHPINFSIPEGIKITVDKATFISITGVDKMLVGEVAARIRSMKKPEPYQGTGIRYVGEHVVRKAGKAAAGASGGKK